jgi:hypothetical protein
MDLQKIRVRQDLERMVINYFLMGKISREQADKIADYVDGVIGGGCLPEPAQREGKIIYFPETGQDGKPREPPKALEQRKPSFGEHREGFKGDPPGPTKTTHIRIREDIMDRVKRARPEGGHSDQSEAAFLGYLIGIGINVYEKHILPAARRGFSLC